MLPQNIETSDHCRSDSDRQRSNFHCSGRKAWRMHDYTDTIHGRNQGHSTRRNTHCPCRRLARCGKRASEKQGALHPRVSRGVRRKIENSIVISTVGLFCHGPACGHKGFGEALSKGPTSPPNVEPIPRSIWKIGRGENRDPKHMEMLYPTRSIFSFASFP